jgi:hypothetical protein
MTGFSLPEDYNSNPEKLLRKKHSRKNLQSSISKPPEEGEKSVTLAPTMAEKSLRDYSTPTTDNVSLGPQGNLGNVGFELKTSLINMVQASPFCGLPHEDANAHLQCFLNLCATIVIRDVEQDTIHLRLFPFCLIGKAQ